MTAPFPVSSLESLRGRTGYGAALYLRRGRVEGEGGPEGFGPQTLSGRETGSDREGRSTVAASLGPAVILPLDRDFQGSSPVELLVAPGDAGIHSPLPLAGMLVLTGALNRKPLRLVRLLQAGLGGAASILGLVFIFSASRSRPAREETQLEKSGEREP
jgi:hypothetical protein